MVALHYARIGLTLTHYDARGHLIVARRIADSITPGWQQIGAVWLPLPHVLNALPVQIDAFYRTGASAVAISVASFAVACACIAWLVAGLTESRLPAVAATLVFALNPNVLYLQATPMTEPLLLALILLSVALLMRWIASGERHGPTTRARTASAQAGWAMALACLTRYEAWPVVVSALGITLLVRGPRAGWSTAVTELLRLAAYPGAAIAAFLVFSRIVGGAWFADDFFVPENPAQGQPFAVIAQIIWGLVTLSATSLVVVAALGALTLVGRTLQQGMVALLPLTLMATAAVPFVAFLDGHPYRIRYMVVLVAVEAVCAGAALALLPRRARALGALALTALALVELRPLDAASPMVAEAKWDQPNIIARDQTVTRCLVRDYDRTSIMASMGSLGHYMQDLSRAGFSLRDFLHEGNGDIWLNALNDPRPYVGWMLIEEKAEGGDMLARRARENPQFLAAFSRVCEGAGLALFRRHTAGTARSDALAP